MIGAGRLILYVIAPERFRDEELAEPRRILESHGFSILIASTRAGEATGMLGARVTPGTTLSQVNSADVDALAIAGGAGAPQHLWDSEPLRALVKVLHVQHRPLAAICLAPPVLARAGVLSGKRATTFPADRAIAELKRGGATYVRDGVILDGTILTASGPEEATAFGEALATLAGT